MAYQPNIPDTATTNDLLRVLIAETRAQKAAVIANNTSLVDTDYDANNFLDEQVGTH
jgi:hypothetical protein